MGISSSQTSTQAPQVTLVVKEARLMGELGAFQAALRQQVSQQRGRRTSDQGKAQRVTSKKGDSGEGDQEIISPCSPKQHALSLSVSHLFGSHPFSDAVRATSTLFSAVLPH